MLLLLIGTVTFSACSRHGDSHGPPTPVANLQLQMLDGTVFSLASYRDNSIIVLDFWATWCPPCLEELPIMARLYRTYRDRGIIFCAVNQQEPQQQVRSFVERIKLELPVALDLEGKAARLFEVASLPTVVIIDRQGIVHHVEIGFHPGTESILKSHLDTLLER